MDVYPGLAGSLSFVDGLIDGVYAKTLRDTGCTFIGVKESLVKPECYLKGKIRCATIVGNVVELPTANVFIDTPYFKGRTVVGVLPDTTVADIIVGNVENVLKCHVNNVVDKLDRHDMHRVLGRIKKGVG